MHCFEPFTVQDTHGILCRDANVNRRSSDRLGWTALYASSQRESPFEGHFLAVKDQLVVLHVDGPVTLDSSYGPSPSRATVPAGGLHMVPGGVDFGVRLTEELSTVHVYLRRRIIEEVAAELTMGDPSKIEIPPQLVAEDRSINALMLTIQIALNGDDFGTPTYVDYLARALASRLVVRYSGATCLSPPPVERRGVVAPVISRALDYMRNNIDMPLCLDDIAGAVNCSAAHLARQFRASLGVPPHQYLLSMRIRHAQHLLVTTADSIAEIAFACGFSHQEHLTRMFRRWCDTTPAVYRRAARN